MTWAPAACSSSSQMALARGSVSDPPCNRSHGASWLQHPVHFCEALFGRWQVEEDEGDDRNLKTVGRQRQPLNIHECQRARVPLFGQAEHALRTIDADDHRAWGSTPYRRQQCTRASADVDNAPGRAGERTACNEALANRPDDGTPPSVIGFGAPA